jgi:hypothetical protein
MGAIISMREHGTSKRKPTLQGREDSRFLTFSRSILFIAPSIPLTTFAILPVTCRIVTAVCTRLLTASMRLASRRRLSFSFCLRMAFCA